MFFSNTKIKFTILLKDGKKIENLKYNIDFTNVKNIHFDDVNNKNKIQEEYIDYFND